MAGAVVGNLAVVADDRHRHIDRIDRLVAVRDGERHLIEVLVVVREVGLDKAHGRRAGIRTRRRGVAGVREVVHRVQRRRLAADLDRRHVVARHRVGLTVVVNRAAVADDGHRHVDRVNRQHPIHRRYIIILCHILLASHDDDISHHIGYRACIVGGAGDGGGELVAVGQGEGRARSAGDIGSVGRGRHDEVGIGVVLAVVIPFIAVGRDGETALDDHLEGAL